MAYSGVLYILERWWGPQTSRGPGKTSPSSRRSLIRRKEGISDVSLDPMRLHVKIMASESVHELEGART